MALTFTNFVFSRSANCLNAAEETTRGLSGKYELVAIYYSAVLFSLFLILQREMQFTFVKF